MLLDEFKKSLNAIEWDIFVNRILSESPLSLRKMAEKHNLTVMKIRYRETCILEKYTIFYAERDLLPPTPPRRRALSVKTWTYEKCLAVALSYPNAKTWRKHLPSYTAAMRNGWLEKPAFQNTLAWANQNYFGTKFHGFMYLQNEIMFKSTLSDKEKIVFKHRYGDKKATLQKLADELSTSPEGIRIVERRIQRKLAKFTSKLADEKELYELIIQQNPQLEAYVTKDEKAFIACLNEAKKHPNMTAWRTASLSTYGKAERNKWLEHPDFMTPLLAINIDWFKKRQRGRPMGTFAVRDERSDLLKILEDPTVPDAKKEALQRVRNLLLGHQVIKKRTKKISPEIERAIHDPDLTREEKSAIMDVFGKAPEIKPKKKPKNKNGWIFTNYYRKRKKP